MNQIRNTLFSSWINVLLLFIPAGFIVKYLRVGAKTTFAINFVAIIPSISMTSEAVEEIGLRTGDIIGALLNTSFANATQLISSILLLRSRQFTVLKTSLLGSIISNLLLMLGLCMFCGGLNRREQYFNVKWAQAVSMMLLLAILSLIVPTAAHLMDNVSQHNMVVQSRGTSVIIIFSYGLYLFFQLKTHVYLFMEPSQKAPKIGLVNKIKERAIPVRFRHQSVVTEDTDLESEHDIEEDQEPSLSIYVALPVLVIFTILIGFHAEFATGSIQTMVRQNRHITQTFVGFVILPLLSTDVSSIVTAMKDKMDLSIALTLERCMQTSLFVVPLVVIVAWGMQVEEMTLEFDGFSVAATFVSILIVTYVIQDGRSNWLVGALLVKIYVIVGLAAYFIQA